MVRKALVILACVGAIGMMSALTIGCAPDEPEPIDDPGPAEQPAPTPGPGDIDDLLD